MKDYIVKRSRDIGEWIVDNLATIRQASKHFGVSKTTAFLDATARLKELDPGLAKEVGLVLAENSAEKHIRGGQATKLKFIKS